MTPLSLALCHFMSHTDTIIDYAGARLAVFVGENGAGKSAVASEAIEFVLFGKARLAIDDLVQWGESEMSVTLTFTHHGATYRVVRGRSLRSGGRSFLELHLQNADGWHPLTGATIAETQGQIERLLGMDHATFRSSVLLKQRDLARFVDATAAERKRILGQVIGLDVFERAEQRAKDLSRDAERKTEATRTELDRIDADIATDGIDESAVAQLESLIERAGVEAAALTNQRTDAEKKLRTLAGKLAEAQAAQADVTRLEQEIEDHKARWRRADETRKWSLAAQERASATLQRAGAIDAAAASLDEARAAVVRLEADESRLATFQRQLEEAKARYDEAIAPHEAAVADFEGKRAGIVSRTSELDASIAALKPVQCPKCGERFAADPAGLAGRLEVARQQLSKLGAPPEAPFATARYFGLLARAEGNLREHKFDAEALRRARLELIEIERLSAQAGQIEDARAALAAAQASERAATEDISVVTAAGKAAALALTAAREKVAGTEAWQSEQTALERSIATTDAALASLAETKTTAAAELAAGRARLEVIARLRARRDELAASIEKDQTEAGRYRRLATAFGVTGIPARIIESILPEFAAEANAILADTIPGWGIEMRAQRAKKSGEGVIEALDLIVLRDGTPRPFEAASGGQQTIFVLALALALSRIAGRRSGAVSHYFGLDEPEGLDINRRRMFGQALKLLAHRGDLELISLVTHNEDLSEFGDRVWGVSANGHGSVVELVAA